MNTVVPHAGTWIEISRIRLCLDTIPVVPHAGTWIEIPVRTAFLILPVVVPHAGTWIEIKHLTERYYTSPSFPTRERGLKYLSITVLHSPSSRSPRGNVD